MMIFHTHKNPSGKLGFLGKKFFANPLCAVVSTSFRSFGVKLSDISKLKCSNSMCVNWAQNLSF